MGFASRPRSSLLVSRHGKVVKRILSATTPNDPTVAAATEAELAKP